MLKVMMAGTMLLAAGYGIGRGGSTAVPMSEDEQGIRRAVQYYFDGSRNADSATMGKGFAQSVAHMIYVRDNTINDVPIPDFLARIHNQRPAAFKPDSNVRRVVSVDFAGNSGIAKLETVTPQFLVIDYMSLVKIDGQWKIVNKIFDRVPRN